MHPTANRVLTCAFILFVTAVGTCADGQDGSGPYDLSFEPLVDGILLAQRPEMSRIPVVGNAVIIPTDDGVVLVDGGGGAAVADQIIERIRGLGSGPLREIVLTHWHDDHSVGLDRYLRAFPGAQLISHPWSRERIIHKVAPRRTGSTERIEGLRESIDAQLREGIDSDTGEVLTPIQVARGERFLADYPAILEQTRRESVAIPRTTTDGMTLYRGERTIEIQHLGPGNTLGDLVVYLPDEKLLVAGDIVTHPVPFGYPRSSLGVIDAIEALMDFDFEVLVLGHGEVQHDREYLNRVLALQRHAVAEIHRLGDEGLDEDAIADALDLSPFDAAVTGGDPQVEHLLDLWYRDSIIYNAKRELY